MLVQFLQYLGRLRHLHEAAQQRGKGRFKVRWGGRLVWWAAGGCEEACGREANVARTCIAWVHGCTPNLSSGLQIAVIAFAVAVLGDPSPRKFKPMLARWSYVCGDRRPSLEEKNKTPPKVLLCVFAWCC